MNGLNDTENPLEALRSKKSAPPSDTIPSSSPAFGTPIHSIRPYIPSQTKIQTVLPVSLPAAILRPVAFRTFTKKHGLTLNSSALQVLATFIGRYCGSEWREKGLAELVLEEVAKTWKRINGGVIVDGNGKELKDVMKNMESSMSGGRFAPGRELNRQDSLISRRDSGEGLPNGRLQPQLPSGEDSQNSLGMSSLDVEDEEVGVGTNARQWLKVIDAFSQPRMVYNVGKKHFDRDTSKPSLLPPSSHKTQVFRQRYNLIHQRLLRNESFQTSTTDRGSIPTLNRSASTFVTSQNAYKLTEIANLLGRNNTSHLLLGLLTISPTGTLALSDLTGSISLDLSHAKMVPEDGAWFVPGMIVLVDGIYEEDEAVSGFALGGGGGVGGTIGGKFVGLTVGGPPCERRQVTLGLHSSNNTKGEITAGGGFGWVDFLGVGSERAIGSKLRNIEKKMIGRGQTYAQRAKMVILGEINLDVPACLQALKKVLTLYASEPEDQTPMTFILMGNFVRYAVMARGGSGGSIEYKEYFDALAALLSEYPTLLQSSTFVFVPGDNDGWASAFSSGAATPVPRKPVPEIFTSRIRRAFATANAEAEKEDGRRGDGEAIWTSNPARLSLFGPAHEIVLFRDDITARFRRSAVRFSSNVHLGESEGMEIDPTITIAESHTPDATIRKDPLYTNTESLPEAIHQARKLVKTLLDQSYLSPFRLSTRPVLWDYAGALQLYPLPTALVLTDRDMAAFVVTYEGCLVMNPGMLIAPGRRGLARWVEYDIGAGNARVRESGF